MEAMVNMAPGGHCFRPGREGEGTEELGCDARLPNRDFKVLCPLSYEPTWLVASQRVAHRSSQKHF